VNSRSLSLSPVVDGFDMLTKSIKREYCAVHGSGFAAPVLVVRKQVGRACIMHVLQSVNY
jgi:hypothetical protein